MPQAAAVIGAFILKTLAITAPAWVAEAIGTIVIAAASYGASAALTSRPSLTPASQKQNIRQPVAPRRRYYGRCKVGGVLAFLAAKNRANLNGGGTASYLHSLVMIAAHEIDAIEEYWLGDQEVTVNGSGLVNEAPFFTVGVRRAKLVAQLGTDAQTAHADLDATFAEWTTNHRLRGIANILGIFKSVETQSFNKVFPNGVPSMRVLARMAKVWDPDDGAQDPDDPATFTWTMNGPRIVMDYVWHADGMRLPRELIELALDDWIEKIDAADVEIETLNSGTEPRYQLSGGYDVTSPPAVVLPLMLEPMGARLGMRGDGAIILNLPDYYEPTVIFTDDQIFSYTMRRSPEAGDLRNEIRATFVSALNNFEEQEAKPWSDPDSIAVDGVQSTTLDLTWSPTHGQTRRRMKREAYLRNPEWIGTITVNAYGLDALGERLIRVQISDLGLDGVFERTDPFAIDLEGGTVTMGILSMPGAAFDWDPLQEEAEPPGSDDPAPGAPVTPGAPTGTLEEVVL